jgi:hypothetical protein
MMMKIVSWKTMKSWRMMRNLKTRLSLNPLMTARWRMQQALACHWLTARRRMQRA